MLVFTIKKRLYLKYLTHIKNEMDHNYLLFCDFEDIISIYIVCFSTRIVTEYRTPNNILKIMHSYCKHEYYVIRP